MDSVIHSLFIYYRCDDKLHKGGFTYEQNNCSSK